MRRFAMASVLVAALGASAWAAVQANIITINLPASEISGYLQKLAGIAVATPVPPPAPAKSTQIAEPAPRPAKPANPVVAALPAPVSQAQAAVAPPPQACPGNPDALGVTRVVEIDTTGGPGFGFEHFKTHNFLRNNEVVLTFDDGPWPTTTPGVLAALAAQCVKATFFPIGKHATWHPDILKSIHEQGHTIGSHTWSHANLAKKTIQEAKDEIERGVSAVRAALGEPVAPFFRFPSLKHPPELVSYLGERNIGIFSTDLDSFDFKMRKGEQVVQSVMAKLRKQGKGIVLMHDFQASTAQAITDLLNTLKAEGYKIVHMKAKSEVQTLAAYDQQVSSDARLPTVSGRPTASVVRTVGE